MGYITTIMVALRISNTFQSSFELTGYITILCATDLNHPQHVSKLFRAYGLYNVIMKQEILVVLEKFQSSFELTGYITLSRKLVRKQ